MRLPQYVEIPEEWRPITRAPGYAVSSLGRVRSLLRRAHGNGRTVPAKDLVPDIVQFGYPRYTLGTPKGKWRPNVHTLVLEAFVGPRPPGTEACHSDGDPLNNTPENLRWDTHTGNMADATAHGTRRSGRIKVGNRDVVKLRHLARAGWPRRRLAAKFGIGVTNVGIIVRGAGRVLR